LLPRRKKRKKPPRLLPRKKLEMMMKRSQSRKKPTHWMSYHPLPSISTPSRPSLLTTKTEEARV